jgi:hypothetical protein
MQSDTACTAALDAAYAPAYGSGHRLSERQRGSMRWGCDGSDSRRSRADVDDGARALLDHVRRHGLRHAQKAEVLPTG